MNIRYRKANLLQQLRSRARERSSSGVHVPRDPTALRFPSRAQNEMLPPQTKAPGLSCILADALQPANTRRRYPCWWPAQLSIPQRCLFCRYTYGSLRFLATGTPGSYRSQWEPTTRRASEAEMAARRVHTATSASAVLSPKKHGRNPVLRQSECPLRSVSSTVPSASASNSSRPGLTTEGTVPVSDGSDMFVEFSVESIRDALRRRESRPNVKHSDEMLQHCQLTATERGGHGAVLGDLAGAAAAAIATDRRRAKRKRSALFAAIPDTELGSVIPDDLSTQQLLYALGRACCLAMATRNNPWHPGNGTSAVVPIPYEQWNALFKSLRRRIHELNPLEITRACQALAYAKKMMDSMSLGIGSDFKHAVETASQCAGWRLAQAECCATFAEMQRHVATHVHQLRGDCLSRVFYASLKGGFPENAGFIEFACAEGGHRSLS